MSGWTRTGFIIGIGMVVTWVCRLIGVTSDQTWPLALVGVTGMLLVYACGWHAYDRCAASTAGREVSGEFNSAVARREAENARLRAALEDIAQTTGRVGLFPTDTLIEILDVARAALAAPTSGDAGEG